MNTTENNKLIAEFMGYEKVLSSYNLPQHETNGMQCFLEEELKFHTSWDWLIPVVNKIYSSDDYIKYKREASGIFNEEPVHINTKFIEETYKAVIEFIKWHNENK